MEILRLQTRFTIKKAAGGEMFFACLLLRNAYVTLHGSQAAEYFIMLPPSLEEWTSQGIMAHPIPENNIFNDEYNAEDDDDIDYDDDIADTSDDDDDDDEI